MKKDEKQPIIEKSKDLPPGLFHVDVLHDDLCNFWDDRPCNCNAEINIRKDKKC